MTVHPRWNTLVRRPARGWCAILLAVGCISPVTSTASTGPVAPNPHTGRTPVKNTIELRSDRSGEQYFMVFVRADPILPQKKYRHAGQAS
ncbi:MAG: hypothetical protein ACREH8_19420, partial [Opitutaceae bacterium]